MGGDTYIHTPSVSGSILTEEQSMPPSALIADLGNCEPIRIRCGSVGSWTPLSHSSPTLHTRRCTYTAHNTPPTQEKGYQGVTNVPGSLQTQIQLLSKNYG